jgi:hypothetical protein
MHQTGLLFRIKKTDIVDIVVVIYSSTGPRRWVGVGGGLESKVQLVSSKGPEWMGIRYHEQDIGLPSKWVYLIAQGVMPRYY